MNKMTNETRDITDGQKNILEEAFKKHLSEIDRLKKEGQKKPKKSFPVGNSILKILFAPYLWLTYWKLRFLTESSKIRSIKLG